MKNMTKAIIFDLNGVFIVSPRLSDRFEEDFDIPSNEFLPILQGIMDKVRQPKATNIYNLWQPYLKKWKIGFSEADFLDYWFSAEKENAELVDLARKLKRKGYKLIVMSNNFRERAKYYSQNFKFLDELFDKVYYSWQTGLIKPDIRAFETIFNDFHLKPTDCLYFDDSEKNVQLANSIGVESYVFDDSSADFIRLLVG